MKRARSEDAKDARRQALLVAAMDQFYERGFAAARMQDIARRAGLSKGTLYLYFDSKDDLFRALIDTFAVPNLEAIEAMTASAPSFADALDAIAAFAPGVVRESNLPKLMKVLAGDSHNFPDIIQSYRSDVLDRVLGAIAALLERARDAGEIAVEHPGLMARLVVAPMAMSMLWQAVFGRTKGADVDVETLFELHAQNLARALAPAGAPG